MTGFGCGRDWLFLAEWQVPRDGESAPGEVAAVTVPVSGRNGRPSGNFWGGPLRPRPLLEEFQACCEGAELGVSPRAFFGPLNPGVGDGLDLANLHVSVDDQGLVCP